jgi:hypothetical protein
MLAPLKISFLHRSVFLIFVEYRSGGQRGATLEELRGTSGADFEGKCDIERGHSAASASVCFCFGGVGGGSVRIIDTTHIFFLQSC